MKGKGFNRSLKGLNNGNRMIELQGTYNTAKVFADTAYAKGEKYDR